MILLSRERIINIRAVSERINETVSAAADIHANDTSRWHLADLSDRLFLNYRIRLAIFKRKFMIKFINNFLNQLPPFFFYPVGGYFVIHGNLSFGALVAVLAAYKDLASPWKELLDWYQTLAGVKVKYETVVENFDVDETIAHERLAGEPNGQIELPNLTIALNSASASGGGSGQEIIGRDAGGRGGRTLGRLRCGRVGSHRAGDDHGGTARVPPLAAARSAAAGSTICPTRPSPATSRTSAPIRTSSTTRSAPTSSMA